MTAIDWTNLATWGKPATNVHQATEPGDWHTAEVQDA